LVGSRPVADIPVIVQSMFMKRGTALLMALCLSGCASQVAPPPLCDMPRGFRTWQGAEVEWAGIILGESHHGFALACETKLLIAGLEWDENTKGVQSLEAALHAAETRRGLLHVRVAGRLTLPERGPVLMLTAVRSASFQPMDKHELKRFFEVYLTPERRAL
jgi:hypothetical protein